MAGKVYCTARHQMHACLFTWQIPGHPGDGTDHECHCASPAFSFSLIAFALPPSEV